MQKNVALIFFSFKASKNLGVNSVGPSSKVSAISFVFVLLCVKLSTKYPHSLSKEPQITTAENIRKHNKYTQKLPWNAKIKALQNK